MDRTMPEVWALSVEEAKAVLTGQSVPFRVQMAHSTNVEEGRLISVGPRPGAPLGPGVEAILTVSLGPPNRPVWPDLKPVLAELADDPTSPLQAYPDPRVDHDRQPPFQIHLQPWASDVAARLHEHFGDGVRLTVGALAYPDPASGPLPHARVAPPANPDEMVATLAEPLTVRSGHTARTNLLITNTGLTPISIRTTGQLEGVVLDPLTLWVVGGFSGATRLPLVIFRAGPGEEVDVPLVVGTASFVPELGYAVPAGEWVVAADLDLGRGRVVRTPPVPLTVL